MSLLLTLAAAFDDAVARCAHECTEETYGAVLPLLDLIEKMPVTGRGGLMLKARAAAWCLDETEETDKLPSDQKLAADVVRGLLRLEDEL